MQLVENPVLCVQNIESGNGVNIGRKLRQMTAMGQNAMQTTLQVSRQAAGVRQVGLSCSACSASGHSAQPCCWPLPLLPGKGILFDGAD